MTWFTILKNEMRSINLPKFTVKPFNTATPSENTECRDKVMKILEHSKQFNVPDFSTLEHFSDHYAKVTTNTTGKTTYGDKYIDGKITTWQRVFFGPSYNPAIAKVPEEVYCKLLDMLEQSRGRLGITTETMEVDGTEYIIAAGINSDFGNLGIGYNGTEGIYQLMSVSDNKAKASGNIFIARLGIQYKTKYSNKYGLGSDAPSRIRSTQLRLAEEHLELESIVDRMRWVL